MIFEAKTVRLGTERVRVRSALSQLLEYRYLHGQADDRLCLVTDTGVSADRVAYLESLGIAVAVSMQGQLYAGSPLARTFLTAALSD